jgi:hypothetical protein
MLSSWMLFFIAANPFLKKAALKSSQASLLGSESSKTLQKSNSFFDKVESAGSGTQKSATHALG